MLASGDSDSSCFIYNMTLRLCPVMLQIGQKEMIMHAAALKRPLDSDACIHLSSRVLCDLAFRIIFQWARISETIRAIKIHFFRDITVRLNGFWCIWASLSELWLHLVSLQIHWSEWQLKILNQCWTHRPRTRINVKRLEVMIGSSLDWFCLSSDVLINTGSFKWWVRNQWQIWSSADQCLVWLID